MASISRPAGVAGLALAGMLGAGLVTGGISGAQAQESDKSIATLRGMLPLDETAEPPRFPRTEERAVPRVRAYPEQPPTIPHEIDGYQVDRFGNKCLSCHARARVGESGAPMVSITHYMDRDGQFRAAVSPRRYFCTQCHVPQTEGDPPAGNDFVDVDALLEAAGQAE